jgi:hypothetical protein
MSLSVPHNHASHSLQAQVQRFNSSCDFSGVAHLVRSSRQAPISLRSSPDQVGVSYIDSDNDEITVSSNEELQDFYQSQAGDVFKLNVLDLSLPRETLLHPLSEMFPVPITLTSSIQIGTPFLSLRSQIFSSPRIFSQKVLMLSWRSSTAMPPSSRRMMMTSSLRMAILLSRVNRGTRANKRRPPSEPLLSPL